MPVPVGQVPPDVAAYLEDLELRLGLLEDPQEPQPLARMVSTDLTTVNAAFYAFRFVYLTNLNMTAHSNGAHWYRSDTGALIV